MDSRGPGTFDGKHTRAALRGVALSTLRDNAYARVPAERRLPPWIFPSLLAFLGALRVGCVFVLIAALAGWFLDASSWAGAAAGGAHRTPFHGHVNVYGWRLGFQGLVAMHVVTGAGLFAVCLVPLFVKKGGRAHALFGRAFVALWSVHLVNGLVNSAHILLTRGLVPSRYFDGAGAGFSLYLYVQFAFISFVIMDFLAHGMAALHYKDAAPSRAVRAAMIALPATSATLGVAMAGWAVGHLAADATSQTATPYAVVYLLQVPAYLFLAAKNVAYWVRPEPRAWRHGWLTEHQRNMMFCVGATLYTGLANLTMRHVPSLTAPVFASIDVGFLVWLLVKERRMARDIAATRFAMALVARVRRVVRSPRTGGSASGDEAGWAMRSFDRDKSGFLERDEVRSLLAAQGIHPTDAELTRAVAALDEDRDGRIAEAELARFLCEDVAARPTREQELAYGFRRLDRDGDGRVSCDELRAEMERAPRSQAERLEALSRVADMRPKGFGFETFSGAVDESRGSA